MKRGWFIGGGIALGLFVLLAVVTVLLPESTERLAGSLTNARPNGSRALGQVLQQNGVATTQVTTLDEAAAAPAGATLVIYLDRDLSDTAATRLSRAAADLVIVATDGHPRNVRTLSDQRLTSVAWWESSEAAPAADCADPDATAAGTMTRAYSGVEAYSSTHVTVCFGDDAGVGLYADTVTDRHRVTAIAGGSWLRNDTITAEGNAALGLRAFGRHSRLVWYLPGDDAVQTYADDFQRSDMFSLLPGWAKAVTALLVIAAAAAALWRGRRFGALVREQLPVAVPASEAASGLGRLYRQSSARGHAAAGLRAATLRRVAAGLGVPTSASPGLVVERLAEATGRPQQELLHLCYGPPPASDAELLGLATHLSDLERELTIHD
jgi:hypothetical protein